MQLTVVCKWYVEWVEIAHVVSLHKTFLSTPCRSSDVRCEHRDICLCFGLCLQCIFLLTGEAVKMASIESKNIMPALVIRQHPRIGPAGHIYSEFLWLLSSCYLLLLFRFDRSLNSVLLLLTSLAVILTSIQYARRRIWIIKPQQKQSSSKTNISPNHGTANLFKIATTSHPECLSITSTPR